MLQKLMLPLPPLQKEEKNFQPPNIHSKYFNRFGLGIGMIFQSIKICLGVPVLSEHPI